MVGIVVSRLAQTVVLLLLVSLAVFCLLRLAPGDPGALMYGPTASQADLAQVRERWGLDSPVHVQYFRWLSNALGGDLGRSYVDGRPVLWVVGDRMPATLVLAISALLLAAVAGTTLGIGWAGTRTAWLERLIGLLTTAVYSTPPFWFGILLILLFSVRLGWLPPGGFADPGGSGVTALDLLRHLALPVLALAARDAARFARVTRASVLAVAAQDYVRTAAAKGLSRRSVNVRHILRNALLPVSALLGISIPGFLSGAVIVETVFAWPGLGRLAIESALQRNYPVIMGEVLVVAVAAIAGSILADVACAMADPRVRRGNGG
jgi:peptide/nickel transport system permease protein